jgi:hypothetical protein
LEKANREKANSVLFVGLILAKKENTKAPAILQRKAGRQLSRIVKQHSPLENVIVAQLMTVFAPCTL